MIKNDMQKVVLITGVSSGFGKAIAEQLLAQGHIVYGTSRRNLDFDLNGLRIKHLDVTQKDVGNEVVGSIVEEQGHLDKQRRYRHCGSSRACDRTRN